MKIKSIHQKGKDLENWIVERLRLSGLDKRAYRQKGSGSGLNKGDVWNALNICIEAKNQKNFHPAWFNQAERESMGTQEPIVVWHPPQKPLEDSKVFMKWDYFERLLLKGREPANIKEPSKELKWRLKRFVDYGKDLLKELE